MLALTALSCVYDYNPEIGDTDEKVVVEGDIILGGKCSFQVSLAQHLDGSPASKKVSASFSIEDDGGYIRNPESSSGVSAEFDLTDAPTDRKYRLHVHVKLYANGAAGSEDRDYYSPFTSAEPAPVIKDITVNTDSLKQGRVVLQMSLNAPSSSGCFRWDHEEIYRYHSLISPPAYEYVDSLGIVINHFLDHSPGRPYSWWNYTWCWGRRASKRASIAIARTLKDEKLENHAFLSIDMNDARFHKGPDHKSCFFVKLTARTISLECYRYLEALNRASEQNASLLSPVPGELVGNIRNAADPSDYAIGYVCVTSSSTRMFRVPYESDLSYANPVQYYINAQNLVHAYGSLNQVYYHLYHDSTMRPHDSEKRWVPLRCIDCRFSGGDIDVPDDVVPYL